MEIMDPQILPDFEIKKKKIPNHQIFYDKFQQGSQKYIKGLRLFSFFFFWGIFISSKYVAKSG
jgi:hypothetical protein